MASDNEKTLAPTKSNESAPGGMRSAFSRKVLVDSVVRLSPKSLVKNPVMLIVEITFFIVAAMAIIPQAFVPVASPSLQVFYVEVAAHSPHYSLVQHTLRRSCRATGKKHSWRLTEIGNRGFQQKNCNGRMDKEDSYRKID